jgi:hypothetical protein
VGRQLGDLALAELLWRVVDDSELFAPSVFSQSDKLLPGYLVADDVDLLLPRSLLNVGSDELGNVPGVREDNGDVTRGGDGGKVIGDVDDNGQWREVRLDLGDYEVVEEVAVVNARVVERSGFESLDRLELVVGGWEDSCDTVGV